jgi:hypothetical protein
MGGIARDDPRAPFCVTCHRRIRFEREQFVTFALGRSQHLYCYEKGPRMIDITKTEELARDHAGTVAGEYLESVGKTDLATLTPDEWAIFLQCVIGEYQIKMVELRGDEIPF